MTSPYFTRGFVLFAILSACACAPPTFDPEDDLSDYPDQEKRPSGPPVEFTLDTILGVLRAHAHTLRQLESAVFEQKKLSALTSARYDEDAPMIGIKRKRYWQPLGYLPASIRIQHNNQGLAKPDAQDTGSNVFRYG
ncbi:unnamed protein product [Lymnaea stagnalis]|uniref:Uncharacterized protein n=1 Tax=Lymnaea stagnalis TaxID=6523 RepID=A0AAV2HJT2_LYMST